MSATRDRYRLLLMASAFVVLLGSLTYCWTSSKDTGLGVTLPPNARDLTLRDDVPTIWGAFWGAIVGIDGRRVVVLEIGIAPSATSEPTETQRYELRIGERVVVKDWDIQLASIDPGPREVVIYVVPGPGAPPAWTTRSAAPTSSPGQ